MLLKNSQGQVIEQIRVFRVLSLERIKYDNSQASVPSFDKLNVFLSPRF